LKEKERDSEQEERKSERGKLGRKGEGEKGNRQGCKEDSQEQCGICSRQSGRGWGVEGGGGGAAKK